MQKDSIDIAAAEIAKRDRIVKRARYYSKGVVPNTGPEYGVHWNGRFYTATTPRELVDRVMDATATDEDLEQN